MTLQLSNPIFIMTTHWDKHWDGVTNSNYDEKWKELSKEEFYSEFSSIAEFVMAPGWYLATKLWRL